mgnify:CR=1 FL=1
MTVHTHRDGPVLVVTIDRPDAPVPVFERAVAVSPSPVRQVPTRVSRSSWMPWALCAGGLWLALVLVASRRIRRRSSAA